jgi:precorrin-2 dehydrogenase / sirohydrochlorin ferrochelatase
VTKDFYMACLDVAGRRCVVVGGGSVGFEKAAGLAACGAAVTVVSPGLHESFSELEVEWVPRRYRTGDLEGAFLVIAATSDRAVNEHVHGDAESRGMLCNVADVPELCNFILPAVHRQGPIAVAVSTGGASPALAKRLRSEIAEIVTPEHAELAEELRAMRPEVKERFATYEERRDHFEEIVEARLG